ncbi:DUF262 domain-containing protein [Mycoplasmopsis sturni]|uniref:DUF262 domain-containing protein n=1 Tax=Mycoplasmopsis sturni TaxID=39047 RepID=UPI00055AA16D|nr:DUF262 domain-containing protein [Mycoplasmopsis sturni]
MIKKEVSYILELEELQEVLKGFKFWKIGTDVWTYFENGVLKWFENDSFIKYLIDIKQKNFEEELYYWNLIIENNNDKKSNKESYDFTKTSEIMTYDNLEFTTEEISIEQLKIYEKKRSNNKNELIPTATNQAIDVFEHFKIIVVKYNLYGNKKLINIGLHINFIKEIKDLIDSNYETTKNNLKKDIKEKLLKYVFQVFLKNINLFLNFLETFSSSNFFDEDSKEPKDEEYIKKQILKEINNCKDLNKSIFSSFISLSHIKSHLISFNIFFDHTIRKKLKTKEGSPLIVFKKDGTLSNDYWIKLLENIENIVGKAKFEEKTRSILSKFVEIFGMNDEIDNYKIIKEGIQNTPIEIKNDSSNKTNKESLLNFETKNKNIWEFLSQVQTNENQNRKFIVPFYQRTYIWDTKLVEDLFEDVIYLSNKDNAHYLGQILLSIDNIKNKNDLKIVDGQQRITTLILFILALYVYGNYKGLKIDKRIIDLIKTNPIIERFELLDKSETLKSIKKLFNKEFDEKEILNNQDPEKTIYFSNYKHFVSLIKKHFENLHKQDDNEKVQNEYLEISSSLLDKLYIAETIHNGENDFEIFQRINSYRKSLNNLDLLKSSVFALAYEKNENEEDSIELFKYFINKFTEPKKKNNQVTIIEKTENLKEFVKFLNWWELKEKYQNNNQDPSWIFNMINNYIKNKLEESNSSIKKAIDNLLVITDLFIFLGGKTNKGKLNLEKKEPSSFFTSEYFKKMTSIKNHSTNLKHFESFLFLIDSLINFNVLRPVILAIYLKFGLDHLNVLNYSENNNETNQGIKKEDAIKVINSTKKWYFELERFIFYWKWIYFEGQSLTNKFVEIAKKILRSEIDTPEKLREELANVFQKDWSKIKEEIKKENSITLYDKEAQAAKIWLRRINQYLFIEKEFKINYYKDDFNPDNYNRLCDVIEANYKKSIEVEHIYPVSGFKNQEVTEDINVNWIGNLLIIPKSENSYIKNDVFAPSQKEIDSDKKKYKQETYKNIASDTSQLKYQFKIEFDSEGKRNDLLNHLQPSNWNEFIENRSKEIWKILQEIYTKE